jgi:hypothetical protein
LRMYCQKHDTMYECNPATLNPLKVIMVILQKSPVCS